MLENSEMWEAVITSIRSLKNRVTAKTAGQKSKVYECLSLISHGLNLEKLAPGFEPRREFRSIHSLKYLEQNDLELRS